MERKRMLAAVLLALLCGVGLTVLQRMFLTSHIWIAILWGAGAFMLTIIAWIDYRTKRISNRMLLALFFLMTGCRLADWSGLGSAVFRGLSLQVLGEQEWVMYSLGFLFPLALMWAVRQIYPDGIGGGDGKLFLVLGVTLGFDRFVLILFYALLILAVLGVYEMLRKRTDKKTVYPMAPAIWIAYLMVGCMSGGV